MTEVGAPPVREVPDDNQAASVQAGILRYLADHPHAADSAQGIASFWITGTDATGPEPPPLCVVQGVLDQLVAQGRIRCVVLADGTRVYEAVDPDERGGISRRKRAGPK